MIEFFFDYLSPYAYLAWTQIHELAERHGETVEPVPVLLAGLLGHNGTLGPAEVPAKRVYVFKDCVRTAVRLGVPLAPPPSHPFNPLLALRVSCLAVEPERRIELITALFTETWAGGRGVDSPEVIDEVATAVGIQDAVGKATTSGNKARLRDNGERAIALGHFGVPTLVTKGEMFWGLDSFDNLEAFLEGSKLPDDLLERWQHVKPSAKRRV